MTHPAFTELASDRPAPGLLGLAERGLVPDLLLRRGIARLCAQRLAEESQGTPAEQSRRFQARIQGLRQSPIAIHTDAANTQHYELPPDFFKLCLGKNLKYSSAYYPTGRETLDQAEEAMLALYGERAELADGQDILELGCGWGALALWMARAMPGSRITAVSNSASQGGFIRRRAEALGLANVKVVTADMNDFAPDGGFDRIVSVEMF